MVFFHIKGKENIADTYLNNSVLKKTHMDEMFILCCCFFNFMIKTLS